MLPLLWENYNMERAVICLLSGLRELPLRESIPIRTKQSQPLLPLRWIEIAVFMQRRVCAYLFQLIPLIDVSRYGGRPSQYQNSNQNRLRVAPAWRQICAAEKIGLISDSNPNGFRKPLGFYL